MEERNGEMGLDFSPGRRECVGWGFTDLGKQERKKCSRETTIVYSGFIFCSLAVKSFKISFPRLSEGEDDHKGPGSSHGTSQQDLAESLNSSGYEYHRHLNVKAEMFVLPAGKDFKHQCDRKSIETHTYPN